MTVRNQALFWLAVVAASFLLLWLLSDILLPFIAGMAVAYLLDPLADRLERAGLSRTFATSIILGLFFGAFLLVTVLLYPVLVGQLVNLLAGLPALVEKLREALLPIVSRLLVDFPDAGNVSLRQAFGGSADKAVSWIGGLLGRIWGGGIALVNFLSLLVVTPIVAFYLLRDWDKLVQRIDSWLPRQHAATIRAQAGEINRTLAGFVRGQLSVCLVMAVYYALALSIIGLDFGLIIGLLSGAISFIPYVGALLGFGVSVAVALVQFWPEYPWIIATIAVFALGQFAEGNLISPKLVGDRVGLHPVWLIFALLAFGLLFGFVGILIAVPAAAVIGVLTRFAIARYLDSRLYLGPAGRDPEPRPATPPADDP
ncbi:MAG: AI-2E family transporter [Alphaproteobacteria bacterium]|nr:AI-2E family transporter [Alphaproteobacteria bacterium]